MDKFKMVSIMPSRSNTIRSKSFQYQHLDVEERRSHVFVKSRPGVQFSSAATFTFEGGSVVTDADKTQHIVTMTSAGIIMSKRSIPTTETEFQFDVASCVPNPVPKAWTFGKTIGIAYGILTDSGREAFKLFNWRPTKSTSPGYRVTCTTLPAEMFPVRAPGSHLSEDLFSISSNLVLLSEDEQLDAPKKVTEKAAAVEPAKKNFFLGLLNGANREKKAENEKEQQSKDWFSTAKLIGLARYMPSTDTPRSNKAERYLFSIEVPEVNGIILRDSRASVKRLDLQFPSQRFDEKIDISFNITGKNTLLLSDGLSAAVGTIPENFKDPIQIPRIVPCTFVKAKNMFKNGNWNFLHRAGRFVEGQEGTMWHVGIATRKEGSQNQAWLVFQKFSKKFISEYLSSSQKAELKCYSKVINHVPSGLIVDA